MPSWGRMGEVVSGDISGEGELLLGDYNEINAYIC